MAASRYDARKGCGQLKRRTKKQRGVKRGTTSISIGEMVNTNNKGE